MRSYGACLVSRLGDTFGKESMRAALRGPLRSAELYDPVTGTWTDTGRLNTGREVHTATLLANGEVLVAGGFQTAPRHVLASAELYDPVTGTWTDTGRLNTGRDAHTATLLANGEVLVAGGFNGRASNILASAELYDPGIMSP